MCWELGSCGPLISSSPDVSLSPLSRLPLSLLPDHGSRDLGAPGPPRDTALASRIRRQPQNPGILRVCTNGERFPRCAGWKGGIKVSPWNPGGKTRGSGIFPSSVFSGRFKGNFWRGFSKNPPRPLVLKRFMGKKSGDGMCIWILNHGLREGRLIQREPGNAPPKHSPGSQIFRGK